jgi:DNA-binding LacI/PurR family transcriptional regulator
MPKPNRRIAQTGTVSSIVEFAKYLDLSVWTVSRAINGHPEVKEETRRRVLAAMEEVGYRPNPLARGLGRGNTGLIGVSSIGLDNPILNTKIYHLQNFMRRHDRRVVLEMSFRSQENECRIIEDFVRLRVDGIVLLYSTLPTSTVTPLLRGLPCLQVDPLEPQTMPSISIDRRWAMRLLFEHLLRLEHRSFGLLFPQGEPWRGPALVELARAHGLDPAKVFRHAAIANPAGNGIEIGQAMTEEVLRWPDRPTALIARDDQVALGAIQALREAGVEVPREMSVTGFDNLDLARRLHPTLTTIDQGSEALMARAGEMLLAQMVRAKSRTGATLPETVAPEIVVGESTGPARRA